MMRTAALLLFCVGCSAPAPTEPEKKMTPPEVIAAPVEESKTPELSDQQKIDAAKKKELEERYPEVITVRVWFARDNKFFDPVKGHIRAKRVVNIDESVTFCVPGGQLAGNTTPVVGSEITDKDGVVWVVKSDLRKSSPYPEHRSTCVKK